MEFSYAGATTELERKHPVVGGHYFECFSRFYSAITYALRREAVA